MNYLIDNQGASKNQIEQALAGEHTRKTLRQATRRAVEAGQITLARGLRGATLHSLTAKTWAELVDSEHQTASDLHGEVKTAGQPHTSPDLTAARQRGTGDLAVSEGPPRPGRHWPRTLRP